MPVARNVWLPIGAKIPATAARRRIRRQASAWAIGCFGQHRRVVSRAGAKQPALAVLSDASGIDVGAQHLGEGVMARTCSLPPFSCNWICQPAPSGRRSAAFMRGAAHMRAKE